MTASVQDKELQDDLYYKVWFEFLMNYDKINVRNVYQKEKERKKNAVDAEVLRAAGYSEEDIRKAQLD